MTVCWGPGSSVSLLFTKDFFQSEKTFMTVRHRHEYHFSFREENLWFIVPLVGGPCIRPIQLEMTGLILTFVCLTALSFQGVFKALS